MTNAEFEGGCDGRGWRRLYFWPNKPNPAIGHIPPLCPILPPSVALYGFDNVKFTKTGIRPFVKQLSPTPPGAFHSPPPRARALSIRSRRRGGAGWLARAALAPMTEAGGFCFGRGGAYAFRFGFSGAAVGDQLWVRNPHALVVAAAVSPPRSRQAAPACCGIRMSTGGLSKAAPYE